MAAIVVRPALPEDLDGYFDVRSLTFNDGNPVPDERRIFKNTRPYVGLVDGEVAGIMSLLDLTCTRGPATLPCGGLAGVGVYPHRRKTGVGSGMLSWLVRHLRESGTPMSSLYAFREPFYRRFGYEVSGKRLRITCPTHRFPSMKGRILPEVRRLKPADWGELDPCYVAFAHARSGLSLRSEALWMRVLGENRPLTIYAAGDPVEAYAVVSHASPFWTTDHISEVSWSTPAGYDALMDTFAGLAINKSGLSWWEPSDSPFYARYLDQGLDVKLDRPVMYRVCDVRAALLLLRPDDSGKFTLRVHDDLIPENEGPWRVAYRPGEVAVEPCSDADLTLDIRAFTQAFLGDPSLVDLARLGLAESLSPAAFAAAVRLLPPLPVLCTDYF